MTRFRSLTATFAAALVLLALGVAPTSASAPPDAEAEPAAPIVADGVPPITQGINLNMYRCGGPPSRICGKVRVPLDRANPASGKIQIGFMLFRHTDHSKPALTPIVAQEGGPGYATTYSYGYYKALYAPIMARHDLLMIDSRGTGLSSPIDCEWLQSLHYDEYDQWVEAVGACGEQLGDASDLYTTAHTADDMADIIYALGWDDVNLYGDSYGTFFAQTFAVRHPGMLRTLVLDAAYPVEGQDIWQRDWVAAQVQGYRNVCDRDPGCDGDPMDRVLALLDQIRVTPITGKATNDDGALRDVIIDPGVLAYVFTSAGYAWTNYRDFDGAVKAALNGDNLPLLRLTRNSVYLGGGGPVKAYSQGLASAVSCLDYPQPYDLTTPLSTRESQWDAAVADLEYSNPNAFFPFTVNEFVTSPIEDFDSCMLWPTPDEWTRPMPPGHTYPNVPTLVLVGDLDSVTSPEGSMEVAAKFPNSTFVEVPNGVHVTALGDHDRCVSGIVLLFTETTNPGDTDCVNTDYPEVRAVDDFWMTAADVPADSTEERAALIAKESIGDAIARWYNMYGANGTGLRGGTFKVVGYNKLHWNLDGVMFVDDVAVSGKVKLNRIIGHGQADVTLTGAVPDSTLHFDWNDYDLLAMAHVTGTVGATPVDIMIPAPNGI